MNAKSLITLTILAIALLCLPAQAGMINPYTFQGNGNWSIDGVGSNNTPVGTISAIVPLGSTVERAYLYSTTFLNPGQTRPTVVFDGTTISGGSWSPLGLATSLDLVAFRTDVTAQVATRIGGGSAAPFSFSINSESVNTKIDGEALVIVYSNPGEVTRTIAILDGFTDPLGDSASFNFTTPLTDPSAAGFEAIMSLGIGYGWQGANQYSIVDVNGNRLTTSAGGQDDGLPVDGALITIGGIGDSTANPANPYATPLGYRYDDELYDLRPFLSTGDTAFSLTTQNPSDNDNIFFVGLNITAEGSVIPGGPNAAPVPSAALLGLTMLGGLALVRRIRRRD